MARQDRRVGRLDDKANLTTVASTFLGLGVYGALPGLIAGDGLVGFAAGRKA